MDSIQKALLQLNSASQTILDELSKGEPSLDYIQQALDQREGSLTKLNNLSKLYKTDELPKEKRVALKSLFNDFTELNKRIQQILNKTLDQYQEKLADATKRRKAEDKYHALKVPDISHF